MKKTASLLVVLAAFFTMSSAFSAETPKFGADRHVARGMAPVTVLTERVLNILIRKLV